MGVVRGQFIIYIMENIRVIRTLRDVGLLFKQGPSASLSQNNEETSRQYMYFSY